MKLQVAGAKNRLNVEHRTPNIERPILMTLRLIDFKTSASQNPPQADKIRKINSLVQRGRMLCVFVSLFLN
jgi:hypothetical protein